jgi:hypothetical protein
VASIVAGYLGVSALLGWDSLRWEKREDGRALSSAERVKRTMRVSLFNGLWLAAVPRALADLAFRRGPIRYVKMDHRGEGEPVLVVRHSGDAGGGAPNLERVGTAAASR